MKYLVIAAIMLVSIIAKSQETKGIKFETALSWAQIKQKAKKEDKYIFLDCFTTWCGPCKQMAREVFPQQKVGDFFNAQFINVAVQFDKTPADNNHIRAWYKDAKKLHDTYKIVSYPTYLFLNPDGELVYSYSEAAEADTFIAKAATALSMNYEKLKKDYVLGKVDTSENRRLIKAAMQAFDMEFLKIIVNDHLKRQSNLLTPENVQFITMVTATSSDPGYKTLVTHPEDVDRIAGKGKSREIIRNIAFEEVVLPMLKRGGRRVTTGIMYHYEGETHPSVNWKDVQLALEKNYPEFAEDLTLSSKIEYYKWQDKWPEYTVAVQNYLEKAILPNDKVNGYAWDVFLYSNDPDALQLAIGWSEKTLSDTSERRFDYKNTYSHLLYKSGESAKAIGILESAARESKNPEYFSESIKRMKEGKKLW